MISVDSKLNFTERNNLGFTRYDVTGKSSNNLAFGAGISYKRISLELRYINKRNLFKRYANLNGYLRRYSVILGYDIFQYSTK